MYIVSRPKPLSDDQNQALAKEDAAVYPPGYLRFLRRFGEGTYRGWLNVQLPDAEVLKPFAEYGLWEHDENSPITEQQIGECIVIGTTVDGDFLAVYPQTAGLLWLPRHAEHVKAIFLQAPEQEDEGMYALVLDEIYRQVYGIIQGESVYYEPWTGTRSHRFLRLPQGQDQLTLPELAGLCQHEFPPDLFNENAYACFLFYRQLGGYVRLNYAYQQEVAVFYEQDTGQAFADMEQWLLSKGCEAISENNS
ncbi:MULTISPECIES: hypothetical protein [Paenibacillus]|uniref:Uncharacterized protein n=1 Tax=Paenibacillus odorifer TaxID=189426 RepID=A0A1R0XA31_9BACL|nr:MULTISPECIES: hypothetical protein [Paenibacillus]AIQ75198.1 hypothetical protein PODO_19065 [Paenibacillus odorifer]ETT46067.1 hypothetical protein C171_30544 [Paenibacillus sp. FSL H8-237]OMD10361.1 hypothetical protein BJP47_06515 [Paenibacillus odorifer]OMD22092.1 hypothetical protein BJP48_07755 [Paenibacillus odorifer]OMD31628.1 hypothetical protein BJP51_17495 [Paenibacillus odorifer]